MYYNKAETQVPHHIGGFGTKTVNEVDKEKGKLACGIEVRV